MGQIYKRGKIYWIGYSNGKPKPFFQWIRESTKSKEYEEAERLLKQREGEIASGNPFNLQARKTKISDLLKLYLQNCKSKKLKSVGDVLRSITVLDESLGNIRATDFLPAYAAMYRDKRASTPIKRKLKKGAPAKFPKPSTINRELSILKAAFHLGVKYKLVTSVPFIEIMPEDNVRTGFLPKEEFEVFVQHFDPEIQAVLRFAYITGWRLRSQILNLQWWQIDWSEEKIIPADPGSATKKRGVIYFTDEIRKILLAQREKTTLCEKEQSRFIPLVFHRSGNVIVAFQKQWKTVCRLTGHVGLIPHDLRRSAVRNWIRMGVPESVVMSIVGHKTKAMLYRYDIVAEEDLKEASKKADTHKSSHNLKVVGKAGEGI